jgi:hypothetical protein
MTTHSITVDIVQPVSTHIEVGADIAIKVKVRCAEACDLRGTAITVFDGSKSVITAGLSSFDGSTYQTEDLHLKAPHWAGEHAWSVAFPTHDVAGVAHSGGAAALCFNTTPHMTSIAVWDVPTPIVAGRPFAMKLGVRCSALCHLGGQVIEVRDESELRVGHGILNGTVWPGTAALYVAELTLTAPPSVGASSWTASFAEASLGLAHSSSFAVFRVLTAVPPDHKVTIEVTDTIFHVAIEDVDVRLGPYRASTGANGVAHLELPAGMYELTAWKPGYDDAPSRTVEVRSDLIIHLEATPTSKSDPDVERVWM